MCDLIVRPLDTGLNRLPLHQFANNRMLSIQLIKPLDLLVLILKKRLPYTKKTKRLPAAAALSRLLACSRARRRWRWGWGRRSVTSRVTHVTRVARHARARAHHHRFARVITVFRPPRARPARARCCGGGARSIARSLDRAHAVWRWRWRWRSVTSRVTRVTHVTRVARHARARAHHHRFARVITVFRPPRARPARARCCGGGARSIARSLDRAHAVWRWRWRWRSVIPRVTRVTREHVITAHRARHHRPLPRCQPCARAAFARSLICCCVRRHAAHRTCARDLGALVSATPPCMTPHPLCNTHGTHATHNTTRRRQHDDDDDAHARAAAAAAAAALARSLARSRARTCGGGCDSGGDRAYDARAFDDARAMSHSRVGFVMMRERSARWST